MNKYKYFLCKKSNSELYKKIDIKIPYKALFTDHKMRRYQKQNLSQTIDFTSITTILTLSTKNTECGFHLQLQDTISLVTLHK